MEENKRQKVRRKRKNLDSKKAARGKESLHRIKETPRMRYTIPPKGIDVDSLEFDTYDDLV